MLTLYFEGFFQCRLATDSAPYDSKRGNGGWTFSFGSEPDLDRVIRFTAPVALRSFAPTVNVTVKEVRIGNTIAANHSLINARVDLADGAVFEGRNHAIAGDGYEPISPMTFQFTSQEIILRRTSPYDVTNPEKRKSYMGQGVNSLSEVNVRGVSLSTGNDALNFRKARKNELSAALSSEQDPAKKEILSQRIKMLSLQNSGAVIGSLISQVNYRHTIEGPVVIQDPNRQLGVLLDEASPWQCAYWMGAWDADTLTGFVRGEMNIPTR